jgi:hypothetical protein
MTRAELEAAVAYLGKAAIHADNAPEIIAALTPLISQAFLDLNRIANSLELSVGLQAIK